MRATDNKSGFAKSIGRAWAFLGTKIHAFCWSISVRFVVPKIHPFQKPPGVSLKSNISL